MAGGKAHARLGFDLSPDIRLGLSGGIVVHENQFTTGSTGTGLYDGGNGYIEASYQDRRHRIRAFWDRVKATYDEFRITPSPDARFGSFEGHAERVFNLSFGGSLALGGSYRRDSARSRIYSPSKIAQHLWAGFFEGAWRLSDRARLTVSGRGDRHPITGWVFSPRGSLVYSTNPNHALRLSAGTSFKNPAMTESHLSLTQNFGSYMGVPVIVTLLGSRDLKAERITQVETAYRGQLGRVRALATVFHYRLSNIIANHENRVDLVFGPPARVDVTIPYVNAAEGIRSWGGEVGLQIPIRRTFRVTGNYSYQRLRGFAISGNRGPAHKVNAGVSGGSGGLSAGVWLHWVGSTTWTNPNLITLRSENTRLTGYLLSNVHLGYAPGGPLKGFQLSLDAFNLMNHIHHEILPSFPAGGYGQNGEIIRRRLTGTVSWSF
jgi:outer membrane receptor for ferrienterochelin and colicin